MLGIGWVALSPDCETSLRYLSKSSCIDQARFKFAITICGFRLDMALCVCVDMGRPASNHTVRDYGTSGSALQLLTGSTVQLSGYLISWRFYHVSSDSTCDSYAAVWREERDSDNKTSYRLVDGSETPLTSDSRSGVYNTVIEDRIVRVNQGDVVSVHTDRSPSRCSNWVSFRNDGNGDPSAMVYNVGHPLPDNLTATVRSRRAAAIQLHVEG